MRYFSMFSGIGGFELTMPKEYECVGFSEIDKRAIEVYKRYFPKHKNYGDATKIDTRELPDFELLVGGFPCQAFSIAGKRKGFNDIRGTLFFEISRILSAKRPRFILLENVRGLLNHQEGKTFQTILRVLSELGYGIEWCIFNSFNFGVPQLRQRLFIKGIIREKQIDAGKRKIQETPVLLDCTERFRNKNFDWDKIGRVSTRIIRDYAGISSRVYKGLAKDN